MAGTSISNIINPEVLADQISAKFPDQLVLGNTSLVEVDNTFPLGSPGTKFKLPFWKRISAFGDLSEGTAMTPGIVTTGSEFATVVRGGVAVQVYDTAELVSKADPVGEIAAQIARRAAEYIDAKLVLQLDLTPNTFDNSVNAAKTNTAGTLDQNAIIAAISTTLGDNYASLMKGGAIICHSKVMGDLLQTAAIQNWYQSQENIIKTGMLPTLLGLPIYVSDLGTTSTQSTKTLYRTYVVGPGALALFYQRQVMVEFDRDILLLADIVSSNVHFAPHLFGYDDQTTAIVAEQNKSVHVVKITTY